MRMKKRGVSPLIATVLLIAFAVSLGAVVMNWGRGYVESTAEQAEAQSAEKISCSMDTSLGIVQVGNKAKLCVNKTDSVGDPLSDDLTFAEMKFTLINTGSVDLEGVQVTQIFDDKAPESFTQKSSSGSVEKSKLMFENFALNATEEDVFNENLELIEIAPVILVRGVEVVCLEHAIRRVPAEIADCNS